MASTCEVRTSQQVQGPSPRKSPSNGPAGGTSRAGGGRPLQHKEVASPMSASSAGGRPGGPASRHELTPDPPWLPRLATLLPDGRVAADRVTRLAYSYDATY